MDSKLPTRRRWFQFSIRQILGATSWMAICFGTIALIRSNAASARSDNAAIALLLVGLAVVTACPFMAIGTLVGRPLIGALVAMYVIEFLVVASFLFLRIG
jgi:hypothetical protein